MKKFLAIFFTVLSINSFALTREQASQVVMEVCIIAKQCQKSAPWESVGSATLGSIGVFRDIYPTEVFQQHLFTLSQKALKSRGLFVHPASFDVIWVKSTLTDLAEVIYNEQEPLN
jgi:hypothetical protein